MKKYRSINIFALSIAMLFNFNNVFSQATSVSVTNAYSGNNDYIGWTSGTNRTLVIKNEDPRPLNFYTNAGSGTLNNQHMTIYDAAGTPSNAGFVGIGVTNPSSVLHIDGNGTPTPTGEVFQTKAPSTSDQRWRMYAGSTEIFRIENPANSSGVRLEGLAAGSMRLYTEGTQRIHIDPGSSASTGYVGIGNGFTNPASRLHIKEGNNGDVWLQLTGNNTGDNASDGLRIGVINSGSKNAEIKQLENADMLFYTNSSERVRINNYGNVGIGTSTPAARLDVIPEVPVATIGLKEGINVNCDGNNYAGQETGINVSVLNATNYADGIDVNVTGTDNIITGISSTVTDSKSGSVPGGYTIAGRFTTAAGNTDGSIANYGVLASVTGAYNNILGFNIGGYFAGYGTTEKNYGAYGYAKDGNYNYGVYGKAENGNSNYGVYGTTASNANCTTGTGGTCSNAAGYFAGNLVYTESLGLFLIQNLKIILVKLILQHLF